MWSYNLCNILLFKSANLFRSIKRFFYTCTEVDSAVIRLDILDKPRLNIEDEKYFFDIIKASFMQKRKTLVNALTNNKIVSSKEEAEKMLANLGFDNNIRGEKLTLEDYKKIYDYLKHS